VPGVSGDDRGSPKMLFAMDFRRQAAVCVRLAEECDDRNLAERLKSMASDLIAKADKAEETPGEQLRSQSLLLAS
jgi:hypothetical protein